MSRNLLLAAVMATALFATACVFVVTPETAVNVVGTEHTVTATVDEFDIDDICEIVPIPCDFPFPIGTEAIGENIFFSIVQGPNKGLFSDGDCDPDGNTLCFIPGEGTISWTYLGSGGAGIDYIQVCPPDAVVSAVIGAIASEAEMTEEDVIDAVRQSQVEASGVQDAQAPEPDPFCRIVSKEWIDPTPIPEPTSTSEPRERIERSVPNIGAGLSGLFNGQPTALPGAATVSPAATSPVIRPPSTGDAGLQ